MAAAKEGKNQAFFSQLAESSSHNKDSSKNGSTRESTKQASILGFTIPFWRQRNIDGDNEQHEEETVNLKATEREKQRAVQQTHNRRAEDILGSGESLSSIGFTSEGLPNRPAHYQQEVYTWKWLEHLLVIGCPLALVATITPLMVVFILPYFGSSSTSSGAPTTTGSPRTAAPTTITTETSSSSITSAAALTASTNNKLPDDGIVSGSTTTTKTIQSKLTTIQENVLSNTSTNVSMTTTESNGDNTSTSSIHVSDYLPEGFTQVNAMRWEELKVLILRQKLSKMEDFRNPYSSPSKALEWLVSFNVSQDNSVATTDDAPDARLLEIYALAVFYFAAHPDAVPKDAGSFVLDTPHSHHNNNPSNTKSTEWIDEARTSVCHWKGVHCGHLHRVVNLKLAQSELSGSLPAELVGLHHLIELHLSGNLIAGALPPECSELSRLRRLSLADNNLEGSFPSSWKEIRTQLNELDLSQINILLVTVTDVPT